MRKPLPPPPIPGLHGWYPSSPCLRNIRLSLLIRYCTRQNNRVCLCVCLTPSSLNHSYPLPFPIPCFILTFVCVWLSGRARSPPPLPITRSRPSQKGEHARRSRPGGSVAPDHHQPHRARAGELDPAEAARMRHLRSAPVDLRLQRPSG